MRKGKSWGLEKRARKRELGPEEKESFAHNIRSFSNEEKCKCSEEEGTVA